MSGFIKFTHVERLGKPEVEGLLSYDNIYVTSKIDGTNGSIWWDEENDCIACGSRTRELTADKDNGGFYNWVHGNSEEIQQIMDFFSDTANRCYTIYGEWLGHTKFLGAIKDYDSDALGKFIIFDIMDSTTGLYLSDNIWRDMLEEYVSDEYFTEIVAILNKPSLEEVEKIAKENTFLLRTANHPGEGVVLKCADFRNKYGRQAYGKLVLEEYIQSQKARKKGIKCGDVEEYIIQNYVTDAEIAKAIAKCELYFGEEFSNKCGKHIGFLLNTLWQDDILDEMKNILKKTHMPTINFAKLKGLCDYKAKQYAGIG